MSSPTGSKEQKPPHPAPQLSKNELDRITEVFKIYETGLREATIYPKVSSTKQLSCLYLTNNLFTRKALTYLLF